MKLIKYASLYDALVRRDAYFMLAHDNRVCQELDNSFGLLISHQYEVLGDTSFCYFSVDFSEAD